MTRRGALLRLLADGELHSGEDLAAHLAISRAAVWKQLQSLGAWGIDLQATPGHGYRLGEPLDLLDAGAIRDALPQWAAGRLRNLEVHEELSSTSDHLLAVAALPVGQFDACLAEYQSAGRGRRGRRWLAPFASGLCLSVNWSFGDAAAALGALSLAVGVAILRALRRLNIHGLALKWPNDIVHGRRKLGGILIDMRGEAAGPAYVVVGCGINVRLPQGLRAELKAEGVEAAGLAELLDSPLSRNALAASLVNEIALALEEFAARGLAAFMDEWRSADDLIDQPVRVLQGTETVEGLARGIDGDGALLVDVDGARRRILSGEVTVRALR
ncbi:MAG: Bifunctional ligase/repressor BirA [Steroidobacteraceae bacterium]|nr:Bifunctional ligase/repressor BirA [Steroidobacteraceae bacterium]